MSMSFAEMEAQDQVWREYMDEAADDGCPPPLPDAAYAGEFGPSGPVAMTDHLHTPETVRPIPFTAEGPQPLVREIPLSEAYPVEALGPLRGAVEAVQGMTLAPVAIPAASALAVAALAVQGHVDVATLGGTRPVSLYALTVARSGERKSSCDAPLMAALRDFEKKQAKAQRDDVASWENAFALWKGERESI